MKRITLWLLIAALIITCCGCRAEPVIPNGSNAAAKQIVELIEMGIPEAFIANLENEDLGVMYQDLNGMELGEIKFVDTVEGDLHLRMLIVPVGDGWNKGPGDCIRIYGTYQWNNSVITLPKEDYMKLTWDKELLLLGEDSKQTRSYKAKADGSKMECYYDENGFAHIGQGDAGWYHEIKFGIGKHLQKGAFGIILIPVHTYDRVIQTNQAEKTQTEISLEYTVDRPLSSKSETYKVSDKTTLYLTE